MERSGVTRSVWCPQVSHPNRRFWRDEAFSAALHDGVATTTGHLLSYVRLQAPTLLPSLPAAAQRIRRRWPDFTVFRVRQFEPLSHHEFCHLQPRVLTAHRFCRAASGEWRLRHHNAVVVQIKGGALLLWRTRTGGDRRPATAQRHTLAMISSAHGRRRVGRYRARCSRSPTSQTTHIQGSHNGRLDIRWNTPWTSTITAHKFIAFGDHQAEKSPSYRRGHAPMRQQRGVTGVAPRVSAHSWPKHDDESNFQINFCAGATFLF